MTRRALVWIVLTLITSWSCHLGRLRAADTNAPTITHRPTLPGVLRLQTRQRAEQPPGSGRFEVVERAVDWQVAETAIIVCDMWDDHYCKLAAQRVGVMGPRMNAVLTAARDRGVLIVHAPSGTMDLYEGTPHRQRLRLAPLIAAPVEIGKWCHLDPQKEPTLPVDTEKCACDDPEVGLAVRRYTRQHASLDISGFDGVSDNGIEIYNYFQQLGIKNVVLMGVHTNMCVLGRPFGIRQQVRLGMNVALARDLTDAMYDPRQPPYVSHARGTELVVEHIEKYWCPSIVGADLTQIVPGSDDPPARRP